MYCPKCGAANDDNASFCSSCGAKLKFEGDYQNEQNNFNNSSYKPMPEVKNNLVWAILSTIFCCVPFGIVAIVYAAQVDSKLANHDYNGAVESANKSKTWCWVAFGCGLTALIVYIVIVAAGIASLNNTNL